MARSAGAAARLADFVADRPERLFHVGRLDADTEGLILLTNDGELAQRLAHPSYEVLKTYVAEVTGPVPRDLGRRLRAGIELDDGVVAVDSFRVVDAGPAGPWSRSCCTRAASTSCAGCWPRRGTRCSSWCGPGSGRSGWVTCGPGGPDR